MDKAEAVDALREVTHNLGAVGAGVESPVLLVLWTCIKGMTSRSEAVDKGTEMAEAFMPWSAAYDVTSGLQLGGDGVETLGKSGQKDCVPRRSGQ
jgi:hypothetical protein